MDIYHGMHREVLLVSDNATCYSYTNAICMKNGQDLCWGWRTQGNPCQSGLSWAATCSSYYQETHSKQLCNLSRWKKKHWWAWIW